MTDRQQGPNVDPERSAHAVADLTHRRAALAAIDAWQASDKVTTLTTCRVRAARLLNDPGPRTVAADDQIRAAGSELLVAAEAILHSPMAGVAWWDDPIRRAVDVYRSAGLALQTVGTNLASYSDAIDTALVLLRAADKAMALGAQSVKQIHAHFDALGRPPGAHLE